MIQIRIIQFKLNKTACAGTGAYLKSHGGAIWSGWGEGDWYAMKRFKVPIALPSSTEHILENALFLCKKASASIMRAGVWGPVQFLSVFLKYALWEWNALYQIGWRFHSNFSRMKHFRGFPTQSNPGGQAKLLIKGWGWRGIWPLRAWPAKINSWSFPQQGVRSPKISSLQIKLLLKLQCWSRAASLVFF